MLTVRFTENFRIESPTIVTIGTFDGVHLGHQKILNRLKELKQKTGLKTVVLTFEPHPRKVLFPDQNDLKLITLVDEKLELLEEYGVDICVVYPFSIEFSMLDAETYVKEILLKQLQVKHLVIGYDHKFGNNRMGDIQTLKEFSKVHNFSIDEISAQDIDHIAISSSKIRKAIEQGDLNLAGEFLGHHFFLSGLVVKGKQLGRTIGYPTANLRLEADEKIVPKIGVYFVGVEIEEHPYLGMMSIGFNPTTDDDRKIKLEVHIFDFDEDIYGKTLKVTFYAWLREEEKFANLDELKSQLRLDRESCIYRLQALLL